MTYRQAHFACQYWCDANKALLLTVALNSGLSVKTKAQSMCQHSTKTSFKKVQKLKKVWLRLGLNPGWSLFVYVVLIGMYHSCFLSSLYTSAFNNKQNQISIRNSAERYYRLGDISWYWKVIMITIVYCKPLRYYYLLKNSLAVKKGAVLFKMARLFLSRFHIFLQYFYRV